MVTVVERMGPSATAAPAGFGRRIGAYLIDWIVAFILSCLFAISAGLVLLASSDMGRSDPPDRAIYTALIVAALVVPTWFMITLVGWALRGRSVGKLAMSLRIVNGAGARPGLGRSVVRLLVYVVENAPLVALAPAAALAAVLHSGALLPAVLSALAAALVIPLVSVALALRDRRHRALHDLLAGTMVVVE